MKSVVTTKLSRALFRLNRTYDGKEIYLTSAGTDWSYQQMKDTVTAYARAHNPNIEIKT